MAKPKWEKPPIGDGSDQHKGSEKGPVTTKHGKVQLKNHGRPHSDDWWTTEQVDIICSLASYGNNKEAWFLTFMGVSETRLSQKLIVKHK